MKWTEAAWERIKNEPIIVVNTVAAVLAILVTEGLIAENAADEWIRWLNVGVLIIATLTGRHYVRPERKVQADSQDPEGYAADPATPSTSLMPPQ